MCCFGEKKLLRNVLVYLERQNYLKALLDSDSYHFQKGNPNRESLHCSNNGRI